MKWTKEPPTVPGWYGWRDGDNPAVSDEESTLIYFDGVAYFDVWGRIVKGYCLHATGVYVPEWCGPLTTVGGVAGLVLLNGRD